MAQPSPDPLAHVRLKQRLGETIPLETPVIDEFGEQRALKELFSNRPVILVPVYYRCPMLCTQVLTALVRNLQSIDFVPGKEFEILAFSIDPRETPTLAAQKKLTYLRQYKRIDTQRGWHFLTTTEESIREITRSIGFEYAYDARTDQFAHPAAVVLLSPDGRATRYILGLDYSPLDLKFALIDASQGRIGSFADHLVLRCFSYDPASGRYGLAVITGLRVGGVLTLAGLGGLIWYARRRTARRLSAAAMS